MKALFQFLHDNSKFSFEDYYQFGKAVFHSGETTNNSHLQHFALIFLAEYVYRYPEQFDFILNDVLYYANNEKWEIRESTAFIIISAMRKIPNHALEVLSKLILNENENIRRLITESLRPSSTLKWLRDPSKNDRILELLTSLNKDPSIYVRKSVGNNLKDLSKYMPHKILRLLKDWIENSNIKVQDDLASENGLSKDQKRLIWTIKHALRWLQKKNPEYYPQIEKILGKHYILYFDEKRNIFAKPF
jgi:3-methyladenine DNA glycosylase AlkC